MLIQLYISRDNNKADSTLSITRVNDGKCLVAGASLADTITWLTMGGYQWNNETEKYEKEEIKKENYKYTFSGGPNQVSFILEGPSLTNVCHEKFGGNWIKVHPLFFY
jgi:hypothetical protein